MGFKLMIDIKHELYDLWEVRTIQRYQCYNEVMGENEYFIQLNREGKGTNAENILIPCVDEEDMENTLRDIKERLSEQDTVEII